MRVEVKPEEWPVSLNAHSSSCPRPSVQKGPQAGLNVECAWGSQPFWSADWATWSTCRGAFLTWWVMSDSLNGQGSPGRGLGVHTPLQTRLYLLHHASEGVCKAWLLP